MRKTVQLAAAIAVMAPLAHAADIGDAGEGRELYRVHCATCHGIDMTGNGPMAGVLVIRPTDLTRLSANEGGKLPVERIASRIDGRDPLVSHGSPMPVYGHFFEGEMTSFKTPAGQPVLTSKPIADLIAYLETRQKD